MSLMSELPRPKWEMSVDDEVVRRTLLRQFFLARFLRFFVFFPASPPRPPLLFCDFYAPSSLSVLLFLHKTPSG